MISGNTLDFHSITSGLETIGLEEQPIYFKFQPIHYLTLRSVTVFRSWYLALFRIGGSNIINSPIRQIAGGPALGATFYAAIQFGLNRALINDRRLSHLPRSSLLSCFPWVESGKSTVRCRRNMGYSTY